MRNFASSILVIDIEREDRDLFVFELGFICKRKKENWNRKSGAREQKKRGKTEGGSTD
jgi:hypothetical protein